MKKLLSILSVISISITAPLTVVSCNKKQRIIEDEFDYQELTNDLVSQVQEIYNRNLEEDFLNHKIVTEDQALSVFDFISFENLANQDENPDLKDQNSDFFKNIKNDLNEIINYEKLNSEISESIISDINYKPIIKNSGKFFQKFELNNLKIITQQSALVSVYFTWTGTYEVLTGNNDEYASYTADYQGIINIVSEEDVASDLTELNKNIKTKLSQSANDFTFISDSGDLEINAKEMDVDEELKKQVGDVIKSANDNPKYSVDLETAKLKVNNSTAQVGSIANSKFKYNLERQDDFDPDWSPSKPTSWEVDYDYVHPEWWEELMGPVMKKEEGATESFIDKLTSTDQKWVDHQIPESVMKKINSNSNITVSEPINHFNLIDNLKGSALEKQIKSSNYEFAIDEKKDFKTIAAYGGEFVGTKINFKSLGETVSMDLENYFVPIKQNTSYGNTQLLYKEFLKAAITFQQDFLFNDLEGYLKDFYLGDEKPRDIKWSEYNNRHHFVVLDVPDDLRTFMAKKYKEDSPLFYSEIMSQLIEYKLFSESQDVRKFNLSSDFTSGSSDSYTKYSLIFSYGDRLQRRYIVKNNNFDLISRADTINLRAPTYAPELRTYFFSNGLKSKSKQTYFSFGKRSDLEYLSWDEKVWKVNDRKMMFNFNPYDYLD
ncbi:Vmc-like lipoprotein signal peptide domain-containing protein [Spiroplasma endosymbiont of Panorpa germanica]|uniref:Vmc-like lipoprotein signal peptide domain-containing protein n=1 Tax=Spiroplasma endosymbiont of Panorpa germanica TaxID=3066314 RepID=UPI0030CD6A92